MSSYIERYYGPFFSLILSNISVSVKTHVLKASLKSGQSLKCVNTFFEEYCFLQKAHYFFTLTISNYLLIGKVRILDINMAKIQTLKIGIITNIISSDIRICALHLILNNG